MSCNGHYENVQNCYTIKAKHVEQKSLGRGDFKVVHYFLMTDGSLKKVGLSTYMAYEVGNEVCFIENVWVNESK